LEELTGYIGLHEAIPEAARRLDPRQFALWKEGLIVELAGLVRRLHASGWFHRDLYLCHFFIPSRFLDTIPRTWTGCVILIDFHRLTRRRIFDWMARIKDLAQLDYSSHINGVWEQDRRLFMEHYQQGIGGRILGCLVRCKSAMYLRKHRARLG
jgi:heptose I phosphotransferase